MANNTTTSKPQLPPDFKTLLYNYRYIPVGLIGSRALLHPLSVVKTHLQVQTERSTFALTREAFRSIYAQAGIAGFYRGFWVGSVSLIVGPVYALSFDASKIFYHNFLHESSSFLQRHDGFSLSFLSPILAGAVASVVWQGLVVPIDIISQIQMVQDPSKVKNPCSSQSEPSTKRLVKRRLKIIHLPAHYTSMDILRHLFRYEGITGLYRGFAASLAMYVPASGVVWTTYENLRKAQMRMKNKYPDDIRGKLCRSSLSIPLAGCCAGVASGILTNPIDVVRTRIQLVSNPEHATIKYTIKSMLKAEGLAGFTQGIWARTLSHGPKVAIITSLYEMVQILARNSSK